MTKDVFSCSTLHIWHVNLSCCCINSSSCSCIRLIFSSIKWWSHKSNAQSINAYKDCIFAVQLKGLNSIWQSIKLLEQCLMNKTHVLPVCVYFAIFYMFENGAELWTWSCWRNMKLWCDELNLCLRWNMSMNEWIAHVIWMNYPAGTEASVWRWYKQRLVRRQGWRGRPPDISSWRHAELQMY